MKRSPHDVALAVLVPMVLMLYTCQALVGGGNRLYPVILIPGSGGNQLEARLTERYAPSSLVCNRWYPVAKSKEGWFRLWFDPTVLLAPFTKCFAERMTLHYDPELDDYQNAPGVETRVPHFGSTESLLYLDPNLKRITSYMAPLVESLEQIGYENGKTLFGAPYDFRYGLAPEDRPSKVGTKFLTDLKQLIETTSRSNGGKPVILLSHSLGGLFALNLLNRNAATWRRTFVRHLIALSAPWGGTVEEMLTFASGTTLGIPIVDPLLVRAEQRSSESNLWLMPNPGIFSPEKTLVVTPTANYSVSDTARFLVDIGFSEGVGSYETRVLPMMDLGRFSAPGVAVTCLVGTGIDTPERLVYGDGGFDRRPEIVYGDGDGTVNLVSLLALEALWSDDVARRNQTLSVIRVPGVSHTAVLKDNDVLSQIVGVVSGVNSELSSVNSGLVL